MKPVTLCAAVLLGTTFAVAAAEPDVLTYKQMSLDLARDLARVTVDTCRKQGYQVSVVVVDRSGTPQVVMRDNFASGASVEIAQRKAGAVVLSGVSSADLRRNRADIRAELNEIRGVLLLGGGLPITSGGSLLGAIGVAGAPGSEKDEACAAAGIKSVQERLEFAD
jgi:uncharacterized protein GlcG (DUF336 family)